MQNEHDGTKRDQLQEHSLPGTNQAGKGPGSSEQDDRQKKAGEEAADTQEQLDEHSLPGTNQAGKGPGENRAG